MGPLLPDTALGLAAALGGGLLIGLERERRKGRGAGRAAAGVRSFALAALGGGIAQALAQPLLVAVGAALVAALAAVAYWHSRQGGHARPGDGTRDPGLTTELALFITFLVGVLCVQQPLLGAGAAVVVASLLALRERLHRLATQLMSQAEWHDALLLAALALVLLPLTPVEPWPLLGGASPRRLLMTVLLILALQAAGHVALRAAGPRAGLVLGGALAGFVSSTATVASLGARQRAQPSLQAAALAGALASTVATWVQVLLLLAALAPAALAAVAPVALAGAAVAAASVAWPWRRAHAAATGGGPGPADSPATAHGPLRLREALLVAALLAAVAAAATALNARFGSGGVLVATLVGALVDPHAAVAALATLHSQGQAAPAQLAAGAVLAVGANAAVRAGVAFTAGGRRFGAGVALSLALSTGAAALVWALRA